MVPIGPILASSVTVLGLVVQTYRLIEGAQMAPTVDLMMLGCLFLLVPVAVCWLLKTRNLIRDEIDLWCTNKEPTLYRDNSGKVNYLDQAQIRYIALLRNTWAIPSPETRKRWFDECVKAECSKTPLQKIREGVRKRLEHKA
jgi:hypothetical protein